MGLFSLSTVGPISEEPPQGGVLCCFRDRESPIIERGEQAYHNGSAGGPEGPAYHDGSGWTSLVDGSTIS